MKFQDFFVNFSVAYRFFRFFVNYCQLPSVPAAILQLHRPADLMTFECLMLISQSLDILPEMHMVIMSLDHSLEVTLSREFEI